MASLREYRDKDGRLISYLIRVHRGVGADGKQLKPWTTTFEVSPTWKEETALRKAQTYAAQFEKECRQGTATDTRLRFDEYCNYVLDLKEKRGQVKHSTLVRYKELTKRIYPEIGHIKLRDLRVDHLNDLYSKLGEKGIKKTTDRAKAIINLADILKEKKISRMKIAADTEMAASTVNAVVRGESTSAESARKVAEYLGLNYEKSFITMTSNEALSAKTVTEYHRLISTVLEQASKEQLIPFNLAAKATLPKVEKKKVNYFQPAEINAIREALEQEPLKWKALMHLFLITGARRGEILGLKWSAVDLDRNRIHIENSILYSADRGVYEDTPKTETSVRWITIPQQTKELLEAWQKQQNAEIKERKSFYKDKGFLFCKEDGNPMHPDTATKWMDTFANRHNLPHINPHAFRHTMASMLYYNQIDTISISKRLGHAQPSTTANIYAHVIEEADQRNADVLANIFLKKATVG